MIFYDRANRPLHDDAILFSGQAIGVVVADTFEQARYAASLVKVTYEKQVPETDVHKLLDKAIAGRPRPDRGNPVEAFATSEVKIESEYTIPIEHHNAMELHASVANWDGNKLTIYDKTQGVNGVRGYLASIFGIPQNDIIVLAPFVGGGFGSGLRPSPNTFLTPLAAREVKRPVKIVYSRRQVFTAHGYGHGRFGRDCMRSGSTLLSGPRLHVRFSHDESLLAALARQPGVHANVTEPPPTAARFRLPYPRWRYPPRSRYPSRYRR